jgi:hypothetical protein
LGYRQSACLESRVQRQKLSLLQERAAKEALKKRKVYFFELLRPFSPLPPNHFYTYDTKVISDINISINQFVKEYA